MALSIGLRKKLIAYGSWAVVLGVGAYLAYLYCDAATTHKRGLILGCAGALLLAIEPLHKRSANMKYRNLTDAQGPLTPETLAELRRLQLEEYVEHSWPVFLSVLASAALLACGFYMDYFSE